MSRRRFSIVRVFKVRESGNAEFWIANLIVMASTVLGVYLAAQAGFKTALQFEVARSERDGFYMRRALLDEVKDNLESVDDWSQTFEKALRNRISASYFLPSDTWIMYWSGKNGWSNAGIVPDELKMKTFVWETMKQQTITFHDPVTPVRGPVDVVGVARQPANQISARRTSSADRRSGSNRPRCSPPANARRRA